MSLEPMSARIRTSPIRHIVVVSALLVFVAQGCVQPERKPGFTGTYSIPESAPETQADKLLTVTLTKAPDSEMMIVANSPLADATDAHMRGLVKQLEDAYFRPGSAGAAAPEGPRTFKAATTYNVFKCKMDAGQLAGGALLAGLTMGVANSAIKVDATYRCKMTMVAHRSDGASRTYSSDVSLTGKVGSDPSSTAVHTQLLFDSVRQAVSQLSDKVRADSQFWK